MSERSQTSPSHNGHLHFNLIRNKTTPNPKELYPYNLTHQMDRCPLELLLVTRSSTNRQNIIRAWACFALSAAIWDRSQIYTPGGSDRPGTSILEENSIWYWLTGWLHIIRVSRGLEARKCVATVQIPVRAKKETSLAAKAPFQLQVTPRV